MTNHAVGIGTCNHSGMTIPSYLHSEMHLQKFTDQTELQSWIVNFHVEVCANAKNLALVLQWIRSKHPARWRTSSIQNQLRWKISLIMKNWIWWWRQNWNGATIMLIWSAKLPSVEPWQDKRAKNSHTEQKNEECVFSGRQLDSVQKETLVVFYTNMPRRPWGQRGIEVERRKKISPRASILFSTESEETDWREKLTQSEGQSCD